MIYIEFIWLTSKCTQLPLFRNFRIMLIVSINWDSIQLPHFRNFRIFILGNWNFRIMPLPYFRNFRIMLVVLIN